MDIAADVVDSAARDTVTVRGPDAQSYLHSQVAQQVQDLPVGETRWTLVLEPTGKITALARLTRTAEDAFVLDTDAGYGDHLARRLERFKIRVNAEIEVRRAERIDPSAEHEERRVAVGWPRMGHEIIPGETIPAITGILPHAVDFAKGCYPGQELVERMDSRGADAPKSLRIVDVDERAMPGDPILDERGAEVGALTSVAGSLGLGYVKRGGEAGRPPTHLDGG